MVRSLARALIRPLITEAIGLASPAPRRLAASGHQWAAGLHTAPVAAISLNHILLYKPMGSDNTGAAGAVHPNLPGNKDMPATESYQEATGSQKTAENVKGKEGEAPDMRVAQTQDQGEGDSNVPQQGTGKAGKGEHIHGVDIGAGQSPD